MNECIDERRLVAVVRAAQGFVPAELVYCNLSVVCGVCAGKTCP